MLESKPFTGSAHTGLYLITDHQSSCIITDVADARQEIIGRNNDTGLTLDRFKDNRGGLLCHKFFQCLNIPVGTELAGNTKRLKRLADCRLVGTGKRTHGSSVEVMLKGDELVAAGCTDGKFHCRIICLGTGVSEKDLSKTGSLREFFSKLCLTRHIVEIRAVDQRLRLFADSSGYRRMTVPGTAHRNTCDQIKIFFPGTVPDVAVFPQDDLHVPSEGGHIVFFIKFFGGWHTYHSYSMVAGGLLVISYRTRFTWRTSLMILLDIFSSTG